MKMTKDDKSHVMSSTCNVSTAICRWNEHTATDLTCLSYSSKMNDATVNHSCVCMTISASANLFPLNLFHMFYFCLFINSFSYISYEEALSCTFSHLLLSSLKLLLFSCILLWDEWEISPFPFSSASGLHHSWISLIQNSFYLFGFIFWPTAASTS